MSSKTVLCESDIDPDTLRLTGCAAVATTKRLSQLSLSEIMAGDKRRVKVVHFCAKCAEQYDDAIAEARWEARVS